MGSEEEREKITHDLGLNMFLVYTSMYICTCSNNNSSVVQVMDIFNYCTCYFIAFKRHTKSQVIRMYVRNM